MGTRLADIIFDRHEDHLYEDERAMRLTPYVMAERCLQAEIKGIFEDYDSDAGHFDNYEDPEWTGDSYRWKKEEVDA